MRHGQTFQVFEVTNFETWLLATRDFLVALFTLDSFAITAFLWFERDVAATGA